MTESVFIAYDFDIRKGLLSNFEFVRRKQPDGFEVKWPGESEGMTQGEIWRDIVKPQLQSASRFVAYVDLPNANVGYEIGYAWGMDEGRRVALARVSPKVPDWLKQPPLDGFMCPQLDEGSKLLNQILGKSWNLTPRCPRKGQEFLLLCPSRGVGSNYIDLFATDSKFQHWHQLSRDGWTLKDLPDRLDGVGVVVWLIVPHTEGEEARDGSDNAALSVVAGYADACGIPVKVFCHIDARVVVDVAPKAWAFSSDKELLEHMDRLSEEVRSEFLKIAAPDVSDKAIVCRPEVGQLPDLDMTFISHRFIGRERLLGDLGDALKGLMERHRGEKSDGAAKVQAIWYHGFGGMGKSWFLRRAMGEIAERKPMAKAALIDWDNPTWRLPLTQPPQNGKELLEPVALRLAQLYGADKLDHYWRALERTQQAEAETSRLRERFLQGLRVLAEGKSSDEALEIALSKHNLWAEGDKLRNKLESLRTDQNLHHAVFVAWFENGGGSASDPDAVIRPDALRVNALQACMRNLAEEAPLVLILDTCEVIPLDLERWLRQLIAPLCDGRTAFLVLYGSRSLPDVAERPGSREVWRAVVGEERWRSIPFDEDVRFTVQEIARALRTVEPPVDDPESLAERLHRITLGVPLAFRSLLDLHEEGDDIIAQLEIFDDASDDDIGESSAQERVVSIVADRFLLHLSQRGDRLDDYRDIIALSLLPKADRETLSRLWKTGNVRGRLNELAVRYSLLAIGDLHATVRSFLRRHWRSEERPRLVDQMISDLAEVMEETELPGQPGEVDYFEARTLRLNALAWKCEVGAYKDFAPAIALALAYDQHVLALIELAAEIRPDKRHKSLAGALRKLVEELQWSSWWVDAWGNDEILAWLEDENRRGRWSDLETASLDLLRGLKFVEEKKFDQARDSLLSSINAFSDRNVPQQNRFGEALFAAAYALAESSEDTEGVVRLYEGAIRLDYSPANCYNNIGARWFDVKRYPEAESSYRKALALAQNEPLYLRNLGELFRAQALYDEAEQWYRKAIAVKENYAEAYSGLGMLFEIRKNYADAEAQYRKAAELNPKEAVYPYNLGKLYRTQERYQEAEAQYRKAMDLNPKGPWYPYHLGELFRDQELHEEAEQCYRRAIAVDENYAAAYNGLGLVHESRRHFTEAERQYRKASALNPKEVVYPYNLGELYRTQERFKEAEDCYCQAIAVDESHAAAYNGLGLVYKALRRFAEAEAQYRKAMELEPKGPWYPYNLGELYRTQERSEEAEQCYRQAIAVDESYAAAYNGLGLIFEEGSRNAEAEAQYRKAAELNPEEPLYSYNLGELYRSLERSEEAEQCYRQAIAVDESYAAAYNGLGLLFKTGNHYSEAETQFRKAAALNPKEPVYPYNLGEVFLAQKQYREAEECYRQALLTDENYVSAYSALGLVFEKLRQYAEAEAQYRKAVSISPQNAEMLNELAWFLCERGVHLEEAEACAQRAVDIDRQQGWLHTLAMIQMKRGKWDIARTTVSEWLKMAGPDVPRQYEPDVLGLMQMAVRSGHAKELSGLLKEEGVGRHWLPWAEAVATLACQQGREPLSGEALDIRQKLNSNPVSG
ncbi:MAG: tetratricopeptide repeat protein [Gammaproteobacteria bacterium]